MARTRRAWRADIRAFAIVLLAVTGSPATAAVDDASVPSDRNMWAEAAGASGYDRARADAPGYDDKAVWPGLTGKEAFTKVDWPESEHFYIWRRTGESAQKDSRRHPQERRPGIDRRHSLWQGV